MELHEAKKIFDTLYESINGYGISMAERKQMAVSDKTLTYGEATLEAMNEILLSLPKPPGGVLYDLGSGTGKAVFAAALLAPFTKCVGVEILSGLYNAANEVLKNYKQSWVSKRIPWYGRQEISFRLGDLFTYNYGDADVVFVQATCFSEDVMFRLGELLSNMRPGTHVVTVTGEIESPNFALMREDKREMGWGRVTVYTYERV